MWSRQSGYRAALRLRLRLQQSNDERVVPRSASVRGTTGGAVDSCLHPLRLFQRHVDWSVRSHTGANGGSSPRSPVGAGISRRLRSVRLSRGLPHDNAGRASFLPRDPGGLETMVALSGTCADSRCGDRDRAGGVRLRRSRWGHPCDLRGLEGEIAVGHEDVVFRGRIQIGPKPVEANRSRNAWARM